MLCRLVTGVVSDTDRAGAAGAVGYLISASVTLLYVMRPEGGGREGGREAGAEYQDGGDVFPN